MIRLNNDTKSDKTRNLMNKCCFIKIDDWWMDGMHGATKFLFIIMPIFSMINLLSLLLGVFDAYIFVSNVGLCGAITSHVTSSPIR